MTPYKLAPSILSADFARLGGCIQAAETAGAHLIHFDVMDGLFVPNISFGVPVLRSIRPVTRLPFDVHLMITHPLRYLEPFAEAGADMLNVHCEAADDVSACLRRIRELGKKAAVTVNPGTPVSAIFPVAELIDMALVMSVEPGFGGQAFNPDALRKTETLANYFVKHGLAADIEIDGGITLHNARAALDAGVNVLVAGSAVFGATDSETTARVCDFLSVLEERRP